MLLIVFMNLASNVALIMLISIIILGHFLHLLYLFPCPDLGLFMLRLCDVIFIFILIFIMINLMNTDTLVLLLIFQNISYYFWMIMWRKNVNNFKIAKVLLIKELLIGKACNA